MRANVRLVCAKKEESMSVLPSVAGTASLIGDPARVAMLLALVDGRALPAGELAFSAGVTAQTASSHLARLLDGGLLAVEKQGRHRYYRLAGAHVAQALEQLAAIRPVGPVRRKAPTAQARELRFARCCYDHLAGWLGVAVTDALTGRGFLLVAPDKLFEVTPAGAEWFAGVGVNLSALKATRRGLARQCLDWTERAHHLAGPLGVAFLSAMCESGWLRRTGASRAVVLTPKGQLEMKRRLDLDASPQALPASPNTPRVHKIERRTAMIGLGGPPRPRD
jgi:DNA-binding transcriptional ArsR family regulator